MTGMVSTELFQTILDPVQNGLLNQETEIDDIGSLGPGLTSSCVFSVTGRSVGQFAGGGVTLLVMKLISAP